MGGTGGADGTSSSGALPEVKDAGTPELETSALPPHKVCCRLRPPAAASDPTGHEQSEERNSISVGNVAAPGNRKVEAGSATSEALCAMLPRGQY